MDAHFVSINGLNLAPEDARISVFDHGFLFGDSVYEVVRTARGRMLAWDPHIDRLLRSAEAIGLEIPTPREQLRQEALALLREADYAQEAYLRLIITRGVGELSIDPVSCGAPTRIFIARPMPRLPRAAYEEGIALSLVSRLRNSHRSTSPSIKSGNYLNNVLALMEARRSEALEAIMLNAEGQLTECTTSNIFLVKDGEVATPSLSCGLLAGITRQLVLDQARQGGLPIREAALTEADLRGADEVFITSSTRDVVPVARVDETRYSPVPGPLTERVAAAYERGIEAALDPDVALPRVAG